MQFVSPLVRRQGGGDSKLKLVSTFAKATEDMSKKILPKQDCILRWIMIIAGKAEFFKIENK